MAWQLHICLLMMQHSLTIALLLATTTAARAGTDHVATTKTADTATALTIAGTAVPLAMIVGGLASESDGGNSIAVAGLAGIVIGPALGHLYAPDRPGLELGLGVRVGAVALAVAGAELFAHSGPLLGCWGDGCGVDGHDGSDGAALGLGLVATGVIAAGASIVFDLGDAGAAARRYNHTHALQASPVLVGTSPAASTPGFGVSGRF